MEVTVNEQAETSSKNPRNAFVAFLLSLILPGLGQIYNGQLKKAVIFFGLLLLVPLLFGIIRGTTCFYGLLTLVIIEVCVRIYIIIDGVKNAKRQKDYILKIYNTWYYYLLVGVAMFAIVWIYGISSVLGIQSFKIPTTSNNPTFQVGDRLVADMRAYKNSVPNYGDIVIFKRADGQTYTFRIVGQPNDNLELIDNIITINGKPSKAKFIKEMIFDQIPYSEFEEEFPNGHKHLIYKCKEPYDSTKTTIKNIIVPSGSYYLLGDNRDNAADSRYEGFVSRENILGRIIYSYWGQSMNRINIDFRDK
jgi:signal peptidase I